jgi:hypothetical protein
VLKYSSIAIASNIAITISLFADGAPVYSQEQDCENAGAITANEYTDQNYPYNAFDNNTETRWENAGRGSWLKYKFEYNVVLTSVHIAWHQGNEKVYPFRIQAADNATADFRTIFSANSSGSTTHFEHYTFNDTLANRIKIQVYGNDVDNLSSISEVRLGLTGNSTEAQTHSSATSQQATIVPSFSLPSAEDVWQNETFYVPSNVSNFIMLIPNEGHHANQEEQLSPRNGIFLPTHIVMSKDATLSVLNDDNGHCHTIWVTRIEDGGIMAQTEFIPPGNATVSPITMNSTGSFKLSDPSEPVMQSTIFVYGNDEPPAENVTVGAIYVPNQDLADYKKMLLDADFSIESEYDFQWDNTNNEVKEHTLLIYSTKDPLENALRELSLIAQKTPYT